jgi:hypothetical protein
MGLLRALGSRYKWLVFGAALTVIVIVFGVFRLGDESDESRKTSKPVSAASFAMIRKAGRRATYADSWASPSESSIWGSSEIEAGKKRSAGTTGTWPGRACTSSVS